MDFVLSTAREAKLRAAAVCSTVVAMPPSQTRVRVALLPRLTVAGFSVAVRVAAYAPVAKARKLRRSRAITNLSLAGECVGLVGLSQLRWRSGVSRRFSGRRAIVRLGGAFRAIREADRLRRDLHRWVGRPVDRRVGYWDCSGRLRRCWDPGCRLVGRCLDFVRFFAFALIVLGRGGFDANPRLPSNTSAQAWASVFSLVQLSVLSSHSPPANPHTIRADGQRPV